MPNFGKKSNKVSAGKKIKVDDPLTVIIRKKYADAALEEAARQEAVRREKTKFLNSIIATDQQIALQELNNQQSDSK